MQTAQTTTKTQIPEIILQFYSQQKQTTIQMKFPIAILEFNIQLLNHNHNQPYPIPKEIASCEYPFLVMKQFLQQHQYSPKGYKVVKPINSKDYKQLVDQKTFKVCQKFVSTDNAEQAAKVVNLCRFLRFHQLHDAISAAIATNYYISPNNDKELGQFKKKYKIDELSSEQICEIIKEYEDIFNMIETKAKQEFLKNQNLRVQGQH